jgi:hypothetical protein
VKMVFQTITLKVFLRAAVQCFTILMVFCFLNARPLMSSDDSYNTPLTSSIKDLKMSPQELRIRLRAMIRPILGNIEETADQIIFNTSNPVVRRGVMVWKIETTTTMLSTMLRSDPVLALADGWGYIYQLEGLIKNPDRKVVYGKAMDKALGAIHRIDGMLFDFVTNIQSEETAKTFAANLRQWAEQNPIEGAIYRRVPIDSALAEKLGTAKSGGAFSAIGNLDETTADLMMRLDLYTMYLPRLARWEAELGADDLTRGIDPQKIKMEFERFSGAMDRIATITETLSLTIEKERIATLAGLKQMIDYVFLRLVFLLLIGAGLVLLVLVVRTYFFKWK